LRHLEDLGEFLDQVSNTADIKLLMDFDNRRDVDQVARPMRYGLRNNEVFGRGHLDLEIANGDGRGTRKHVPLERKSGYGKIDLNPGRFMYQQEHSRPLGKSNGVINSREEPVMLAGIDQSRP